MGPQWPLYMLSVKQKQRRLSDHNDIYISLLGNRNRNVVCQTTMAFTSVFWETETEMSFRLQWPLDLSFEKQKGILSDHNGLDACHGKRECSLSTQYNFYMCHRPKQSTLKSEHRSSIVLITK